MDELKPCPFCGGEAEIGTASVFCDNCTAIIWAQPYDNIKSAIDAWNLRTQPGNKPLSLEKLRQMDGEPVFSPHYGWGVVGFRKVGDYEHGEYDKKYTVGFSYGWEWLDDVMRSGPIYAHKPEQEEK